MKSAFDEYNTEQRELALIGGLIVFKESREHIRYIEQDHFTKKLYGSIFGVIKDIAQDGREISEDLLKIELGSKLPSGYNEVIEETLKRSVLQAFPIDRKFSEMFLQNTKTKVGVQSLEKFILKIKTESIEYDEALKEVDKIRENMTIPGHNIQNFMPGNFLQKRREIMQRRTQAKQLFYGFRQIDELVVRGQRKKEISIIAARPGIGKSFLRANFIRSQCDLGFRILSIATEQTDEVETDRIDSLLTGISLTEIENSGDWKANDKRVKEVLKANKYIDDNWNYFLYVNRNLTTNDMMNHARDIINKYGEIDIMYVDLFDKLIDVNVSEFKASVIGKKLGFLSQAAEELNIHICLLVQIHRDLKHVKGYRPQIWHIKDSGAYEEVARLILLLHREKYYNSSIQNNILEINVAKQNNGPAGTGIIAAMPVDESNLSLVSQAMAQPHIFVDKS